MSVDIAVRLTAVFFPRDTFSTTTLPGSAGTGEPKDKIPGQTGSPEPNFLVEKMVSIALRDQLIKSIISQFEEQCRESLSIDQTILESKQGK